MTWSWATAHTYELQFTVTSRAAAAMRGASARENAARAIVLIRRLKSANAARMTKLDTIRQPMSSNGGNPCRVFQ